MVLDAVLFNTQHYKVKIKGKVEQSREWSCNCPYTWKGSLRVILDEGRQFYFFFTYIGKKLFLFLWVQEEKKVFQNVLVYWEIYTFLRIISFVLINVYVSSLLLSSENI